jgi:NAD(P) transhydrogenase
VPIDHYKETLHKAGTYAAGLGAVTMLGLGSPGPAFSQMMTTFGLAGIVGECAHTPQRITCL